MSRKRKRRVEWTLSDIRYLEMNFENTEIPIEKIMKDLNRSEGSIYTYARNLGLSRNVTNAWTEMENEYLKANYENKDIPFIEILEHLNKRSKKSIQTQAVKLGLSRTRCKVTQSDIDFILNNRKMKNKDIAAHLGISVSTVAIYITKNKASQFPARNENWQNWQVEYLKANYANKDISKEEMVNHLGKTWLSISFKAKILGLSRSRSNK